MALAPAQNTQREIEISNVNQCHEWLPQIALWHHNEWLRAHLSSDVCPKSIASKLSEREKTLARHLCDDPLPTTLVAHIGDRPVGTVSLVYYQFTKSSEATEWLTNLFVIPECRCRGIASLLLSCAIEYANSHLLERLLLYTSDQVAFYQKRHWRSINRGVVQGQNVEIMGYEFLTDSDGDK